MKGIVDFVRLTRPVNLLIIIGTMYAMRYFVLQPVLVHDGYDWSFKVGNLDFALSVLVMVLLAGAGNIINDYFDVRVDKINKPNKVIVGKSVKRRVAMATHTSLNLLACAIGFYLGWRFQRISIPAVPILIATMLWFYSWVLKKRPLIGNLVVAFLVASVTFWVGWLEIPLHTSFEFHFESDFMVMWRLVAGYTVFAFLLTLIREVTKDVEDLEGDSQLGFKTLPVVWGVKKTKIFLYALLIAYTIGLAFAFLFLKQTTALAPRAWAIPAGLAVLVGIPSLLAGVFTLRATTKGHFSLASLWYKIAMAGGILFSAVIFWVVYHAELN